VNDPPVTASASSERKVSLPSMKNGRRSSRKVSNAVRFTSDGSASTCPKSGFAVKSRTMPPLIPSFPSRPISSSSSAPVPNGSPGLRAARSTLETA